MLTFEAATLNDLSSLQREGYAKRNYSSLQDYFEAMTTPAISNSASDNIDAGREPYLISNEAVYMGIHPYTAVYDVMIELQDGKIGVATAKNTYFLEPTTVLAWR